MNLRRQHGFTLVEVIITAAFVTVASAAIISVFITIARMNKEARNIAIATALAEEKIETYRNAGYAAIPTGSPAETFTSSLPANFGSPKSAVTNVTENPAGLKRVDVVISYTDDGIAKHVQLSTLVSTRGIDR